MFVLKSLKFYSNMNIFFIIFIILIFNNRNTQINKYNYYNINFDYNKYERNIITDNMIKNAGWKLSMNDVFLLMELLENINQKNV